MNYISLILTLIFFMYAKVAFFRNIANKSYSALKI